MTYLPAPTIDLDRRSYRRVMPKQPSLWLRRLRHPIHGFMAYQAANPDPPEVAQRHEVLFWTAVLHGIGLWLLTR